MAITRWDPFTDLQTLHSQVDEMFDQMYNKNNKQLVPTTDVYTDKKSDALMIEVHLPHFEEKDIKIEVHHSIIEISAEHSEKSEEKSKRKYLLKESSNSFYRQIALPQRANEEGIKAQFKKGLLKITVPLKELPSPKRVSIEANTK